MNQDIEKQAKAAMQAAIDHLKQDLKALRTGRANPAVLDKVSVEVYGTRVRLKEIATVAVPDARQLLISPFNPDDLPAIKKGVETAQLGLNPIVDGKAIRINVPPMDESIRKQIAKQCKEFGEKGKLAVREARRRCNELAKKSKTEGTLPEDQLKRLEKAIQELTDRSCKEIDTLCADKEKEIMTV